MRNGRGREPGFSTIELMVTMVLIVVLAAITVSVTWVALDSSRQRATMADMRTISRAIEAYAVDHRTIPDDSGGLEALIETFSLYTNAEFPITDKWGHGYLYHRADNENYSLMSLGKDGRDGADYVAAARFDFDRDLVMFNGIFIAAPR